MSKNQGQRERHTYRIRPEMEVVKNEFGDPDMTVRLHGYQLAGLFNAGSLKTAFINPPIFARFNRILKRSFDLVFSSIVIVAVLSWLTPILAILIKLSSKGPVFFLQKRNKKDGEQFTCIKFRSMLVNAEADDVPAWRDDKRITRLGRFLRDHYIDELPQFFNVFLGDMSVIGPRPHMVSDNIKYSELVDYYDHRHKVKPGITGLAQVMGYVGVTNTVQQMRDRVNMDIFYLRHWSIRLDIIILFRTFIKPFHSQAGHSK